MQLNLLASKCANAQLVGTKPASADERLLPSPPLCIRRADVSSTVIFLGDCRLNKAVLLALAHWRRLVKEQGHVNN